LKPLQDLHDMKIFTDALLFDRNPPPLRLIKEGCRYYGHRQAAQSSFYAMPVPQSWNPYRVTSVYEDQFLPGCHMRRVNPDFLAIEHIREGRLYIRQQGRMAVAEPGDLVLLFPHCDQEFSSGPSDSCRKSSLLLTGPLLETMLQESGLWQHDILEGRGCGRFEELVQALKALSFDFGGYARERVITLTNAVVQLLLNKEEEKSLPEKLAKLILYLDRHLDASISLEDMAARYGCSGPHLCRLFQTYCNTTPYCMLIRLRMRAATRLLLEENLSIKEIAHRVGYNNAFNFSTEFRKHFGLSPRNFREASLRQ
jgi:AraC-like DNA-binding protein